MRGIEPRTSPLSEVRSNRLSYMSRAGEAGVEPASLGSEPSIRATGPLPIVCCAREVGIEPTSSGTKARRGYQQPQLPIIVLRGPGGNRTPDTRVFSSVLYRLSYRSKKRGPLTLWTHVRS